jgi:hypothetical protein
VVSTPNKLYYAETRATAGPNPFHEHEFEYAEFRTALEAVFPNISMFLENHAESVVFQPVEGGTAPEVRIDAAEAKPADAHFFVAVCAPRTQTGNPTFVFVPSAGNVLRERERHIELLEKELRDKNEWLEDAKRDLAALNDSHATLQREFEERGRWAEALNRDIEAARARIAQQDEQLAGLERENREKTEWALETERRLGAEVEEKSRELARAVDLLHEAEKTVEERTHWALRVQSEADELRQRVALFEASRWVRLGRRFRVGPRVPANDE